MIETETKEFMSFNRNMLLQCAVLFGGICAGLWIHKYFMIVTAVFTVVTALFGKTEYCFYQLLFILPFSMIYKLSPTSTSLFTYAMLAVGAVFIFRQWRFERGFIVLLAVTAMYLIIGMGDNYTTAVKMILGLCLFYIFVKRISPTDFKNHMMAFALGMLGSSCIGLLKGSWSRIDAYYSDLNSIYIGSVKSFRFSGLYLDPNYYSVSAIFAILLCIMLFISKRGNRILLGAIIGALTVFGFISYSKMFLIAILAVALILIISGLRSLKKILVVILSVPIIGTAVYRWMLRNNYITIMTDRLFGGDISTGRFGIWKVYTGHINDSITTLFFGDGLGAGYLSVGGPHNTYIEAIYYIGLFGTAFFLISVFYIFKSGKLDIKRTILNYALPLLFLLMIATLGCFTVNDLMFYFMLIWVGMNISTEQSNDYDLFEQNPVDRIPD